MVAKSRSINNLRRVVMLAHNVHVHYSGIINLKDVFEATEKLKGGKHDEEGFTGHLNCISHHSNWDRDANNDVKN